MGKDKKNAAVRLEGLKGSVCDLPTGTPVLASMALANGMLYMGNFAGKLTVIDVKAQKPAWVLETDGAKSNASSMTNADGTVKFEAVFASAFYDDSVIGVNRLITMGTILSSPVVVGNMVLVGSTDGNLYALQ